MLGRDAPASLTARSSRAALRAGTASAQSSAGAARGRLVEPPEDSVPAQGRCEGSARTPLPQTSEPSHSRGDPSLLSWARRWLGQGPQDQRVLSTVRLQQLSKDRGVQCQLRRSRGPGTAGREPGCRAAPRAQADTGSCSVFAPLLMPQVNYALQLPLRQREQSRGVQGVRARLTLRWPWRWYGRFRARRP